MVSLQDKPIYSALSYVWKSSLENPAESHVINMGENSIGITHNCYEALTHLRSLFGEISIWVDAICIDQTRVEEINHQVKLIGDIYRRAHTVYVWLVSNEWIYSGNLISALEELATDNTAWLERPTV